MELRAQAEQIGFRIVGALVRRTDFEPSHLYQCFFDEGAGTATSYTAAF